MKKEDEGNGLKKTALNIPVGLFEQLVNDAEEGFRSLSKQVVMILSHYYAEKSKKENN